MSLSCRFLPPPSASSAKTLAPHSPQETVPSKDPPCPVPPWPPPQPHPAAGRFLPQDVSIEDLYKGGEQATRFTFFQRSLGSAFRLEAAAWPGWFLCGPAEPQQPVRLAEETEPSARTEFYFEQSR